MDNWIFIALPVAAVIHMFEEYIMPGGFKKAFDNLLPRAAHLFTVKFHIVVNAVFFLLCLVSVIIGKANLILSLSVFGLITANAMLHIRGAIINRGYYPGVISGIFIYIPLAATAFYVFIASRQITWMQAVFSYLLGALYMGILMIYVLVQQKGEHNKMG